MSACPADTRINYKLYPRESCDSIKFTIARPLVFTRDDENNFIIILLILRGRSGFINISISFWLINILVRTKMHQTLFIRECTHSFRNVFLRSAKSLHNANTIISVCSLYIKEINTSILVRKRHPIFLEHNNVRTVQLRQP